MWERSWSMTSVACKEECYTWSKQALSVLGTTVGGVELCWPLESRGRGRGSFPAIGLHTWVVVATAAPVAAWAWAAAAEGQAIARAPQEVLLVPYSPPTFRCRAGLPMAKRVFHLSSPSDILLGMGLCQSDSHGQAVSAVGKTPRGSLSKLVLRPGVRFTPLWLRYL